MKKFLRVAAGLILLILVATCSNAGEISLAWDPSASEGVVGYRIHVGIGSRNYTRVDDVGKVTSVTITGLQTGKDYYFAATAYDDEGTVLGKWDKDDNESGLSNEVSGPAKKTVRTLAAPVLRIP